MLLNAVIIILREVVEAALIISVFLAFCHLQRIPRHWLLYALIFGTVGSIVYAVNISHISNWLEGVGQEIVNATLQILIYSLVLIFSITVAARRSTNELNWQYYLILTSMLIAVSLATIREGTEIIIYLQGFATIPEFTQPVMLGALIGAGIGISMGVFFYYLLVSLPKNKAPMVGFIMLLMVAAGMVSQAVQLLIQADFLPAQQALWNSSHLINEQSVIGQLLYALVGYESTPAPLQVSLYMASLIVMITLTIISLTLTRKNHA